MSPGWILTLRGGVDENRLKRCLKGVIRGEGWISALLGGGGFVLVSQGCVTAQTFVEIEEKRFFPIFSPSFCEREVAENEDG